MPRSQRIHRPHAFYHVLLRGNNGQHIFFYDEDRRHFYFLLEKGIEKFSHRIHGFCFMSNHIHLLIQEFDTPLSNIMQHLSLCYVQYINKKYKRVGHLFQDRYKPILVEEGGYLSEVIRYIHLNPVRAGMVSLPEEYDWSGHRAFLGLEQITWLSQNRILQKFHDVEQIARQRYQSYILQGIGQKPSPEILEGWQRGVIGTYDFIQKYQDAIYDAERLTITRQLATIPKYSQEELITIVCKVLSLSTSSSEFLSSKRAPTQARSLVALLIRKAPHLSLKKFADFIGKSSSTVSRQATEMELKLKFNPQLAEAMMQIKQQLQKFESD